MRKSMYTKQILAAAIAMNAGIAVQAQENRGFMIEEIVVTAQKREQNMQDVAVAVSAFTGESLESQGITQSNQVGAQVPNLSISTNGGPDGAPVFYIRGVGLNDFSVANSGPVGVYQDEVYIKNLWAQNFNMFDLAQVEVLRGPQGTLFGRNTTAGAMVFSSQLPTDELNGRFRVDAGSFGSYSTDVAIGGPLTESVSGRLAIQHLSTDGFVENEATGNDSSRTEKWSYRGTLRFDISDDVQALVKYQGGKKRGVTQATKGRGAMDPATGFTTPCNLSQIDNFQCGNILGGVNTNDSGTDADNDFEPKLDTSYDALMAKIDWDLSDSVTLTSITSFDKTASLIGADSDGSNVDLVTLVFDDEARQYSQELRLTGRSDVSNWVTGVYYLNDRTEGRAEGSILGALAPFAANPAIVIDALAGNVFDSVTTFEQDTVSYAIYGQYEYDLSEDLRFTLGLRYTKEESDMNDYRTAADFPGFPVAPATRVPLSDVVLVSYDDSLEDDNVSWKIGLDYRVTDESMVYAHVSTAFKAGGFNSAILSDQFQARPFEPETSTAYEVGIKSTLWNDRLQINAAAFYYDYEDAQVFSNISSSQGAPARLLSNAPESEMKGFEAEVLVLPAEGLTLQFGIGYVDSELVDFRTEEALLGGGTLITDLSGNTTPVTPEWTYNILASYEWSLGQGTAVVQMDYNWQDKVYFSSENIEAVSQDDYGIVNARLSYLSEDDQWSVSLWGRNLADEEYRDWVSDLSDFGLYADSWGAPRSAGVEFIYNL